MLLFELVCSVLKYSPAASLRLVLCRSFAFVFTQRIGELELEVKQKENDITTRDKVITELRLRLPASAERDQAIAKATAPLTSGAPPAEAEEDYEGKQAVRVAQSTVHSLQQRIAQKEETLQKYQELLRQTREDMQSMNYRHEEEMRIMTEKLHSKNDAAFSKYKQGVLESLNKPSALVPSNEQVRNCFLRVQLLFLKE